VKSRAAAKVAPKPEGTAPNEDEVLVRKAQQGDEGAFEQLYRWHVNRVYAVCLRLCCDAVTAQELTQDAFVRAWERLDSFRHESAFSSWLYRLTVNVVLGDRRSRQRRAAKMAEAESIDGLYSGSEAPSHETRLDLEAAIALLPDGARQVFVLHDVEGYKHEEISNLIGIAPGTSKAHLHRARKVLREQLAS
jgi:RNA polymerase sigma-70 factor (ECF subfamily)